jgi:transposase, IS5 family
VRKLGGLSRRSKQRDAVTRTPYRDRSRQAGRRLKQIAQNLRRRTRQALTEIWFATPAGHVPDIPATVALHG